MSAREHGRGVGQIVRNPYTGEFDYRFEAATSVALDTSVAARRAAQSAWAGLDLSDRIAVLRDLAQAVRTREAELLDALVADTGRVHISRMEIQGLYSAIDRWSALAPSAFEPDGGRSAMVETVSFASQQVPYALVGVISPWNFPLSLATIDAIPALLAGCAVIIKPSEITPRFARPLLAAIRAVPALADVLDIVLGDGWTGQLVVEQVDLVCFTGSIATGKKVLAACASQFKPCFLELGGKDPAIVLAGADLDRASTAILRGAVVNSGQACQSIERIYVSSAVADEFVDLMVMKANAVDLNWPDISRGILGPIISLEQAAILKRQLDDAVAKGGRILCGGVIEDHGGRWLRPTVVDRVSHDMLLMTEETFGPILPIMAFTSTEEAIRLANDSQYGLSGCVFAATDDEAESVGKQIMVGGVSINDASLTSLVYEAEKHAFRESGLGGTRMGIGGIKRFFRKKAILRNSGMPFDIQQFSEHAPE